MIQLYEGHHIDVITNGEITFFKARDVFTALGLTWRNVYTSLSRRGIDNSQIRRGATLAPLSDISDLKGNEAVYIEEMSVYQLAFRSNKKEAQDFTKWCAKVIVEVRKNGYFSLKDGSKIDLKEHCSIQNQKDNSKVVNSKNFQTGGVDKVINYNRENCKLHTGMTPSQVKEIGRQRGLKTKERSSAKEVLRNLKPELAAGMSLTDSLVNENKLDHKKAAELSKAHAVPLFKALIELGIDKDKMID